MRASCSIALSVPTSAFAGFRFRREVITLAVGWYLRFDLFYRDVEELLAERGIDVDQITKALGISRATLYRHIDITTARGQSK